METKVNYVVVGAFVLILGAVLVAGLLWLASGGAWQKKYDLYLAIEDESVAGLNLNAPVKYNGVDVGKVRQIRLDPLNPERVILLLAVEHGTPIKEDTVAVLRTQGLTGIAYVELSGGARNSPPLLVTAGNQYPLIRTKPSLSARLENVLTSVLAKIDNTSSNLNAMLSDENRQAFSRALADIATVTHTLAARQQTIDAAIVDAARTFKNASQISARLGPVADQVGPVIDRIGRGADSVEKMGNEVSRTSASAGKTVNTVGAEVERFGAETLPELERLLGELSALSTSLRRLSEQTKRDPGSFLFGRGAPPDGPQESSMKGQ